MRRNLINPDADLSIRRQCELLQVARSSFYNPPAPSSAQLELMNLIDKLYTEFPFMGSRRIAKTLIRHGHPTCRKAVQRAMRLMGLRAVYPKPNLSKPHPDHKVYPYLLRDVDIVRVNQVWSTDITYVRMRRGFVYLVAVIDWFSRYVLSWRLSNTLDASFCVEVVEAALETAEPEVFNTDQGSQFTSRAFIQPLKDRGIKISMDGKGRALDNVYIERLWWSVKHEDIYLRDYDDMSAVFEGLNRYFRFYNEERVHMSLGYDTPIEVYGVVQ